MQAPDASEGTVEAMENNMRRANKPNQGKAGGTLGDLAWLSCSYVFCHEVAQSAQKTKSYLQNSKAI